MKSKHLSRKRGRRHSPPGPSVIDSDLMGSNIFYALNLIKNIELNDDLLTHCLNSLHIENRIKFLDRLYSGYKENSGLESLCEDLLEEIDNPSGLSSRLLSQVNRKKVPFKMNNVRAAIKVELEHGRSASGSGNSLIDRRLKELGELFNLSDIETEVIRLIYYAFEINNQYLSNIFNELNFNEFTQMVSFAIGSNPSEITNSLSRQSALVSNGIIDNIDHTGNRFISLDEGISEYLAGISEKSIVEKHVRPDRGRRLKLESFTVPEKDVNLMKAILSSGKRSNILLYGVPGTGKTEFARSLAASCSDNVFWVRYGDSETGSADSDSRLLALKIGINAVAENDGILIVDEADFLLNTIQFFSRRGTPEKGWLNDLLDNSSARIIWITNTIGRMEESTLRRFSFSHHFPAFGREERLAVWNNVLYRHPLKKFLSPQIVNELAEKYEVNAGAIASSVDAMKQILSSKEKEPSEIRGMLENLLEKHALLTGCSTGSTNRINSITDKYDLSFLNTDTDLKRVTDSARNCMEFKKKDKEDANLNILLWGKSGTGKTEFVKYLASITGSELIVKRASDLMNMYVGQTEKLIRDAFREAEEKNALLFIDEADSFFTSRERAQRSWEISHTNEFLVQMENFRGILVCCTNLVDVLDSASLRRFSWKVRFRPVLQEKRIPLYEKYFAAGESILTEKQKRRIAAIENLTPGHVKAVSRRMFFCGGDHPDHDSLIKELEREASFFKAESSCRMGFPA